ncbi:MAG: hypothetical protein LC792_20730, partial [Actinobacteria bacterium]|nr:hypothetical protein [Actinomycetota bacterium]
DGASWGGDASMGGRPVGRYTASATDGGEPGRGKDTFTIDVPGAGISAAGPLDKGNVQNRSC